MNRLSCSILFMIAASAHAAQPISFNRDVRAILSDKCFFCHGTDPKTRKADRRIDTPEGAMADIDGVRAIVPGDLGKSEAWKRIITDDKDDVMPPRKENKPLAPEQITKLRAWCATRFTSTICRRRFCTCSASITRGSRSACKAATTG